VLNFIQSQEVSKVKKLSFGSCIEKTERGGGGQIPPSPRENREIKFQEFK